MKKAILALVKLVAFVVSLIVIYVFAQFVLFSAIKPSDLDIEEANGISKFVSTHYPFTEKSKSQPDKFPVFCSPGHSGLLYSPPHALWVYTVTKNQQQDALIKLVREYRKQEKLRPIVVKFYREENWTTKNFPDGSVGGFRGKEEPMRIEKVK